MNIETLPLGPIGTNAYLITNGKDAILIDAPHGAWDAVKERNLNLKAVILTHGHWDHIADAQKFQQMGIPIYAHREDQNWIEDSSIMNAMLPPEFHFKGAKVDHFIDQGEKLNLLGMEFEVRHVPGHAPGNILLYNALNKVAFVGDVIFSGSVGRYDLPGGDPNVLKESITQQIYSLPDETVLYSGHGRNTTVGKEKSSNPFVRG